MKLNYRTLGAGVILTGMLLNTASQAADRPLYVNISGGETRIENTGNLQFKTSTNIGVAVGATVARGTFATAAIEGKYTLTLIREDATNTTTTTTSEYKEETLGAYMAVRNTGEPYLKLKAGAAFRRITAAGVISDETTRFSAGAALGVRLTSGAIMELEYTQFDDNINMVSLGYLF